MRFPITITLLVAFLSACASEPAAVKTLEESTDVPSDVLDMSDSDTTAGIDRDMVHGSEVEGVAGCFDLPHSVAGSFLPRIPILLGTAELFASREEFEARFGQPLSIEVDFSVKSIIVFEREPYDEVMGTTRLLQSLFYCPDYAGGEGGLGVSYTTNEFFCGALSHQEARYEIIVFDNPTHNEVGCCILEIRTTQLRCSTSWVDECSRDSACQQGALCAGLTRRDVGLCVSVPEHWVFEEKIENVVIPDGDPSGVESTISLIGLTGVDADIVLGVSLNHPSLTDLEFLLMNPDGEEVEISIFREAYYRTSVRFLSPGAVNGDWTLRVVDKVSGNVGNLARWTLEISTE